MSSMLYEAGVWEGCMYEEAQCCMAGVWEGLYEATYTLLYEATYSIEVYEKVCSMLYVRGGVQTPTTPQDINLNTYIDLQTYTHNNL